MVSRRRGGRCHRRALNGGSRLNGLWIARLDNIVIGGLVALPIIRDGNACVAVPFVVSFGVTQKMSTGHRITIEPHPKRVTVTVGGQTVADSSRVLALREGSLRPTLYFPKEDVQQSALKSSTLSSHCPFKGDASYYHLQVNDMLVENAVWTYKEPIAEVAQIQDYVAFYESKVDALTEHEG